MDKIIKFIGKDKHGRKVFQGESGRLYCDVAMTHRFGGESKFYTKLNNDFDGEPDMPTPKEWNPQIIESKNKGKQLCRLTESDLHRIVKESVNKILNEVEFGGESLHGNNPEDWAAMKYLRTNRIDREGDAGMYDDDESGYFRNLRNWERNGKNQTDLMDKMYPNDYSNYFERGRALDAKGHNKANRISQKLGY